MLLVFPPQASPFYPHLALPQIAGYLSHHGVENVNVLDLSIELYHHIFREAKERGIANPQDLDDALDLLRTGSGFYIEKRYKKAINYLLFIMRLYARRFSYELSFYDAYYNANVYSSPEVSKAASLYADYHHAFLVSNLKEHAKKERLIGISVLYSSQLIPAIAISRYIRQINPDCTIFLGGSYISLIADEIVASSLRRDFDGIVRGQGEIPILEMCQQLDKYGAIQKAIPNYINTKMCECTVEEYVYPCKGITINYTDWSQIRFEKYLSPQRIIPINFSVGCYWNKCAFCNQEVYTKHYFIKSIDNAVKMLWEYYEATGSKVFSFVDSVLPPQWLYILSREILHDGFLWDYCGRFEDTYTDATLSIMSQAGCRLIRFGLESGSQKVLQRMNKGIDLNKVPRILRSCNDKGISTFAFVFAGFPGESTTEAYETIEFINQNKNNINFISGGGTFQLVKGSIVEKDTKKYGIEKIDEGNDMVAAYHYKTTNSTFDEQIEKIASYQFGMIQKIASDPVTNMLSGIYDQHDLLYAIHYKPDELRKAKELEV